MHIVILEKVWIYENSMETLDIVCFIIFNT